VDSFDAGMRLIQICKDLKLIVSAKLKKKELAQCLSNVFMPAGPSSFVCRDHKRQQSPFAVSMPGSSNRDVNPRAGLQLPASTAVPPRRTHASGSLSSDHAFRVNSGQLVWVILPGRKFTARKNCVDSSPRMKPCGTAYRIFYKEYAQTIAILSAAAGFSFGNAQSFISFAVPRRIH